MNHTKKWLVAIAALILLTMTGCWNRRELNELSIAAAFGFDKKGDKYSVVVQLLNAGEIAASQGSGGQRMPVILQQVAGGSTIFESLRELTKTTPRKIYSSHIRMLVIGEKLAREGIAPVLDILSRDHELRTDFYIVVAKGADAEDVLKVLTPLEKIPANKLFSSLESSQGSWGVSATVDLHELIFDLVSKGKDPALAAIRVIGNPQVGQSQRNLDSVNPQVSQQYQGLAVFRGDKLVGWLNQTESIGYNYIRGKMKSTIVTVGCPEGGKLSVELIRTSSRVTAKSSSGLPVVNVQLQAEGNIGEVECAIDLSKEKSIEQLEQAVNKEIKRSMEASVAKAKKYKSDIFGFGNAIHRSQRQLWYPLEKDWNEHFTILPIKLNVDTRIRQTGSVVESFIQRMEGK